VKARIHPQRRKLRSYQLKKRRLISKERLPRTKKRRRKIDIAKNAKLTRESYSITAQSVINVFMEWIITASSLQTVSAAKTTSSSSHMSFGLC